MAAYLVRTSENKEMVGLFWADNKPDLAAVVDECCDPSLCEAKRLAPGGIFYGGSTECKFPIPAIEKQKDESLTEFCVWLEQLRKDIGEDHFDYTDRFYEDLLSNQGWRPLS